MSVASVAWILKLRHVPFACGLQGVAVRSARPAARMPGWLVGKAVGDRVRGGPGPQAAPAVDSVTGAEWGGRGLGTAPGSWREAAGVLETRGRRRGCGRRCAQCTCRSPGVRGPWTRRGPAERTGAASCVCPPRAALSHTGHRGRCCWVLVWTEPTPRTGSDPPQSSSPAPCLSPGVGRATSLCWLRWCSL